MFYYAPWCKHSAALAPVWDELAALAKDNDDLMIARMNTPENEIEGLMIRQYPTIRLYPRGDKGKGIEFDNMQKDITTLKHFLEEHSSAYRAQFDKPAEKVNEKINEDL